MGVHNREDNIRAMGLEPWDEVPAEPEAPRGPPWWLVCAVLAALLVCGLLALALPAGAQEATVFSVGQAFGDLFRPYVDAAIAALLSAGLAALGAWLRQKWGFEVDAKARDAIQTALANGAAALVARGQVKLNGLTIDVGSVFLRQVADELVARNKDSAARLGLTPDRVAAMLVEHLPKVPAVAQAQAAKLQQTTGETQ